MTAIGNVAAGALVGTGTALLSGVFGMSTWGFTNQDKGYEGAFIISCLASDAALAYAVSDTSLSFAVPAITTATMVPAFVRFIGNRPLKSITSRDFIITGAFAALTAIVATYGLTLKP